MPGTVTPAASVIRAMPDPDGGGLAAVTPPGPASATTSCSLARLSIRRGAPAVTTRN